MKLGSPCRQLCDVPRPPGKFPPRLCSPSCKCSGFLLREYKPQHPGAVEWLLAGALQPPTLASGELSPDGDRLGLLLWAEEDSISNLRQWQAVG